MASVELKPVEITSGPDPAIQIQLRLGNVAPKAVLNAKDGTDYPLGPGEIKLHVELSAR